MLYRTLACDYDGTIAWDSKVDTGTIAALERFRSTGGRLLLVTGRRLDDLRSVFPQVRLFDRIVAENGALLYRPETGEETLLADPPPREFADALTAKGIDRVSVGRVIVATWRPHETTVAEVIRAMALDLQVIFNKAAVMVLPAGVDKATGLNVALEELNVPPERVAGVGDAENDLTFLSLCGHSVAVSNSLEVVKHRVDLVTARGHGEGVQDLIEILLG